MTRTSRLLVALAVVCATAPATVRAQGRLTAPSPSDPQVRVDDDGVWIKSADSRRMLRLFFYMHVDGKLFLSDSADQASNMMAIKRARLLVAMNLNPWVGFYLLQDFDKDGKVELQDAYAEFGLGPAWWIRAGKMTPPVGQERWSLNSDQFFPERSIGSQVSGDRDVGVMLTRESKFWEASAGVYNGGPDNITNEGETNDAKDFAYRVIWRPVVIGSGKSLQGIGLGINGTTGVERGLTGNTQLPQFKTPGGATWFTFRESGGALLAGQRVRTGVFGYAHVAQAGATVEWMQDRSDLKIGTKTGAIPMTGWTAMADWVLTGENSTMFGVTPAHQFDPDKGDWGAVQAVIRASQVSVGDEAFPTFADSATAGRRATAIGADANWFITRNTKFQLSAERTTFAAGSAHGNRRTEDYGVVRFQFFF